MLLITSPHTGHIVGMSWIAHSEDPAELVPIGGDFEPAADPAPLALRTGERSDFIATPVIYKNRVYIAACRPPERCRPR